MIQGKISKARSSERAARRRWRRVALLLGFALAMMAHPWSQLARAAESEPIAPIDFVEALYPVLEAAQCRTCHNHNGVASGTRLHFPSADADAREIRAFGLGLGVLVDRSNPENSLLFQKPTKRLEHTGGERISRGSPEEKALWAWIGYLAKISPEKLAEGQRKTDSGPDPSLVAGPARRLTHSQYNNTVRDLLGEITRPADRFPGEDFVDGFKNQTAGQSLSPLLLEAYSQAAEKLAEKAFRGGNRNGLIPCEPASATDELCSERFIREFGLKAFRRPLTDVETAQYANLFLEGVKRGSGFLGGAQLVVEAMLQSSNFLYRLEQRSNTEWQQFETASRLSYFLWDTMPDEQLLQAAKAGELGTVEEVERAARRMLRDDRARQAMDQFLAQWLRFDQVLNAVRDGKTFREFRPEMANAMTEETRRLFLHLVWEDQNFMRFFDADYTFVSSDLARLYGFPPPPAQFAKVPIPAESGRAGLVGQAAFLTLTSPSSETSPTVRGLFVREHLLCQQIASPPPGVNATLPALSDGKPRANRERLVTMHLNDQACSSCHSLIDPIGFGLEKYDAIGRPREKQRVIVFAATETDSYKRKAAEHEMEIDTSAVVKGIPHSEFSTPAELGRILAKDPGCQECVVKQLYRYALGRPESAADRPHIESIVDKFRASQFRFKELVISLVTSEPFLGDIIQ